MKIKVRKRILSANEDCAEKNRRFFEKNNIVCLNMISSPGSGKTTILARTIKELKGKVRIGVIEGDIQTDLDARRIRATGAPVVQINTEGGCHLSAGQVKEALKQLPADKLDIIIIENVGNLVCPSVFELGEAAKVAVLSVAEGDDKPAKYPEIFARAKAMLINKTDLLDYGKQIDFNVKRVEKDVRRLNREVEIFKVSARTGDGFEKWCEWLAEKSVKGKKGKKSVKSEKGEKS
jgi:hydrogenase nickel incorporation protein HypB